MDSYSDTLAAHLKDSKQDDFAAKIRRSQPAVSRYARGERFPDAETARLIDQHTGGRVPFSLWQTEAMKRIGLGEAA